MAVVAAVRPTDLSRVSRLLMLIGAVLLALSAGGLTLHPRDRSHVAVMVDLSPSTRSATYRNRAALNRRISQLFGNAPYRLFAFSDGAAQALPAGEVLADLPSERTRFAPPQAGPVVFFSDGRFDPPQSAPPTYMVVDPGLEHADDASIARLEARGDTIAATVRNLGPPRELFLNRGTFTVATGTQVITSALSDESLLTARLSTGDAWPENDLLSLHPPPPPQLQRWWIGASPPSSAWRAMSASDLPPNAADYLAASVIVLNNVPADAISPAQQDRLAQYVRDLGGGLVILGGDQAFAAGGYTGSQLDALSPLASSPPAPARQWVLLADSSGSMSSPVDGTTRWKRAAAAVAQLLPLLPPSDPVSVGSFARDLRWWSQSKSASETAKLPLPPADVVPQGPTNLQASLQSIVAGLNSSIVTEILIISDADATIDDPAALAAALSAKQARLHLLATADTPRSPVPRIAQLTGGSVVTEVDPIQWVAATRQLLRAAAPDELQHDAVRIHFIGNTAPDLGDAVHLAPLWNRTWPKRDAAELAFADWRGQHTTLAAKWIYGAGMVAAAAFPATSAEAQAITALVARPPRDPSFRVAWSVGPQLVISIDAEEGERHLNDLDLALDLEAQSSSPGHSDITRIPQTAPGRYELSLPAPRSAVLATVRLAGRAIDRFAVAGRYPPEFDAIGNDRVAMRALATNTGGAVIEPNHTGPIDFAWPTRAISLVSPLAAAGAALLAIGLAIWKLR